MKISKYIDELLEKRARHAERFISCDCQIANWLEKMTSRCQQMTLE